LSRELFAAQSALSWNFRHFSILHHHERDAETTVLLAHEFVG
jgi:hypothetical protein